MKHPKHGYELTTPKDTAKSLRAMTKLGIFDDGEHETNIKMVVIALQEICDWLTYGDLREVQSELSKLQDIQEADA